MKKRVLSILVLLALCLGMLPGAASAATPSAYSKMSASYKNGPYYTKLMNVKLTGNQITDLIAVAASQIGYHESNSKSDLSGTASSSCNKNYTEYGNFAGANGAAWCASFVSWCFREAGIPTSIMPTSTGVGGLRRSVYNNGATWHSVDSGYTPKAGDLVLYESMGGNYSYYQYASRDKNGVPSSSSHVGIVVSDFDSKSQTYCVIDGNGNQGSVKYLTKQKLYMAGPTKNGGTMNRIQGFVTPAYTTGSGSSYDGSKVDTSVTVSLTKPTNPDYTAKQKVSDTNATVVTQITKTPGSSITQSGLSLSQANGTLIKKHTEKVTNVSNSTATFHAWYDIQKELGITLTPGTTYKYQFFAVVNGKTFLGNTYTFRTTGTAPSYTVTFDPHGGTVSPTSMTVYTNDVYGALPIPERAGYTFLGWYTAQSGGTLVTATTDVLHSGGNTLYAHWTTEVEEELDTPSEPETPAPDPEEPEDSEEIIYMYGVYLCNPLNMSYYDILLMADGSTLHLFTPTQAGYDFVGWFDSDGKQYYDGQTMEIHEDMTLYAHFERQTSGAASEPEETTITLQIGSPYMTLNGRRQAIDSLGTAPIARNNRTLLPVRAVIEGLGGTVGWDAENQVVPLTMDGKTLYLKLGSQTAWDSSGKYYSLDSEPIALNNRTYLPIRFVVEYFGGSVGWEPDTQTVKITN